MISRLMDNLARDIGTCCGYNANAATEAQKEKQNFLVVSVAIRTCSVAIMAMMAISAVATLVTVLPAAPIAACLLLGGNALVGALAYDAYRIGDNLGQLLQHKIENGVMRGLMFIVRGNPGAEERILASKLLQNTVLLTHLQTCYEAARPL